MRLSRLTAKFLVVNALVLAASAEQDLATIELTCVDEHATGYATFQSHNQKVLSNSNGIFMTHIRTRNEPYTAQQWRLSRSIDGGRTFSTIYEATHATNPAVIETDEDNNIYLVRPDFADGNSYFYFFSVANDYRDPRVTTIPASAAGKFALIFDPVRKQLYHCSNNNSFQVVALDGTVKHSVQLWQPGTHAILQYESFFIDDANTLHLAWTTCLPNKYLYWDIHYMKSTDGGIAWQKMDGTPLTLPVVADDTGPSDRISLNDEFEVHTWLSNFLVKGGIAHFLYQVGTEPTRQHYMRYDLESARREIDVFPEFKGSQVELAGLDGFFASYAKSLYCIGHTRDGRLGCLASDDNGATWRDHALSREKIEGLYAVGGCRSVTADGQVIGSCTSTQSTAANASSDSKVYFFRIRTGRVATPSIP